MKFIQAKLATRKGKIRYLDLLKDMTVGLDHETGDYFWYLRSNNKKNAEKFAPQQTTNTFYKSMTSLKSRPSSAKRSA